MSTHAKHQYQRSRKTLRVRRHATGNHDQPTAIGEPLYVRHPEMFSSVKRAQRIIAAGKQRSGGTKRWGLSLRQIEPLRNFCRGGAYHKLANRA